MKVKAVVPIKMNSERIPHKSIADLHGKPLCRYLLETLASIPGLDTTVYCSDEKICSYLPDGIHFFKRNPRLDKFSVQRQEIVLSMLRDIDADVYVYAHVTTPFLSVESIQTAIRAVTDEGYDTVLGVTEHRTYGWHHGKPVNFDPDDLKRTQDIDPIYLERSFFVFKRSIALKNGSLYGERIKFLPLSDKEAVDIDYPDDLAHAEHLLKMEETRL